MKVLMEFESAVDSFKLFNTEYKNWTIFSSTNIIYFVLKLHGAHELPTFEEIKAQVLHKSQVLHYKRIFIQKI